MSRLFNGSTDVLAVTSTPVTGVPLTLACWFYSSSSTASQQLVQVDDNATTSVDRFAIVAAGAVAGDPVRAQVIAAGTQNQASTSSGYSTDTWQHACGVFASATDRRAFLNGGSKGTDSTNRTPSGIVHTRIGLARDGGGPMVGRIAEVGVWNVALTDQEVAALARGVSPLLVRRANLVFYAPLWGTSSPERDYTAGQRHLTVTGTTVEAHAPVQPLGMGTLWVPAQVASGTAHSQSIDDSIQGTDASTKAVTHPVADTIAGTDSASRTVAKTQADTIAGTDAAAKAAGHPVADALAGTDSSARAIGQSTADPVAGTDALSRTVAFLRTQDDPGAVTDDSARSTGKSAADTATGTDDQARSVTRTEQDTAALADEPSPAAAYLRTQDDSAQTTDDSARSVAHPVNDPGSVTDQTAAGLAYTRSIDDTTAGTDALSKTVGQSQAETLDATDAVSHAWAALVEIADSAAWGDSTAASAGHSVSITDTLAGTDEATPVIGAEQYAVTVDDAIQGTDAVAKAAGSAQADGTQSTDATSHAWDARRTQADDLAATDAVSRQWAASRSVDDPASVSDQLQAAIHWTVTVNDSASTSDDLAKRASKAQADTLVTTDGQDRVWVVNRSVADGATGVDAVLKAVARVEADGADLGDLVAAGVPPVPALPPFGDHVESTRAGGRIETVRLGRYRF